ncbi:MAG: hypothetical protein LBE82_11770 [Chitinophagaceae bacterium]|jgi:hypothetical protein|nr:hypothetical protein [Chitinophagaceae bacterium]
MTQEDFERASNKIVPRISEVKKSIRLWENFERINELKGVRKGSIELERIPADKIQLDILKAIVLDAYKKELAELEAEFEKL